MGNLKVFNGAMGKTLMDVNTDKEVEDFVNEMLDITLEEFPDYLRKTFEEVLPAAVRKLKVSTVLDLFTNLCDDDAFAEIEKLCEE